MVSGELIVTGKNHAELALERRPTHVKVYFKDDCVVVPCNPTHFDELEWRIREQIDREVNTRSRSRDRDRHKSFFLEISWDVSASRAIMWEVIY